MANSVLAKMAVQISANTAEFNKKMEQASSKLNAMSRHAQDTQTSLSKFNTALSGIGIAGAVGILVNIGKTIFDIGVKAEQTRVQFETFLGSTEKAKQLLGELTKFSVETPFSPDQINSAAKALLSFGVAQKDILPTIKILGDVSSGTGKDLAELAIIFGQIRSTGRLMGQDLLQLINAGFNPLQVISEQTGKSMGQLKKEMEKGLISFDMVEDAFKKATSAGGLFFNSTQNQAKTTAGLLSTVQGNLEELAKTLFNDNAGAINTVARVMVSLTSNTEAFFKVINFAMHTGAIGFVIDGLKKLADEADRAAESQRNFTKFILDNQKALLLTNQTAEDRRKTIQNIIDLSARLGQSFKGTTEDPLPWATPEKTKAVFDLEKAVAAIDARFANLDSIHRKKFEGELSVGKVDTSPLEKLGLPTAEQVAERMTNINTAVKTGLSQLSDEFINISGLIAGGIADLANALGEAAVSGPQDFGKKFLYALASFAQQFGGLLIATGLGEIALKSGNPALMIAGGAALIAAGAAIKALTKPSLSGGTSAGGSIATRGDSFIGGRQTVLLGGEFKIDGRDLVLAVNKNSNLDTGRKLG